MYCYTVAQVEARADCGRLDYETSPDCKREPSNTLTSMQLNTRIQTVLCVLGCLGAAGLAHGEIVLQYTVAGNLNPTTEAANISGSAIGGLTDGTTAILYSSGEGTSLDGSGLPIDDGTGGGPDGRAYGRVFATDGDGNFQHFFQFGLTVDSGSVTFGSGSYVEFDSGHRHLGPTRYAVAYSTDGFASETFIAGGPAVADGLSTIVGAGSPPSGGSFDWMRINNTFTAGTLSSGDSLSFRFYLGESSNVPVNTDFTHYLDNVTVVAAVPEPATYAIFAGLLALGMVAWRRRSR
jgi:hypothetical protein